MISLQFSHLLSSLFVVILSKVQSAELAAHFAVFANAFQQALEAAHLGTHRPALRAQPIAMTADQEEE